MNKQKTQLGFSVVEVILLLCVVGIAVFLGFKYMEYQQDYAEEDATPAISQNNSAINSEQDLNKAEQTLEQTEKQNDTDDETKQLDQELQAF